MTRYSFLWDQITQVALVSYRRRLSSMMWRILYFICLLSCCFLVAKSLDSVRYPENANVYIGAFISVNSPSNNECSSDVDYYSLQEYEGMRWIVDQLNQEIVLPQNAKIGIHAYRTCGIPEKTLSACVEMLKTYSENNSGPLLFALLSPVRSSEAKVVSRFLSQLPDKERLLMLSYGATSSSLSNRELYRNFYRVIPPDKIQVSVMLQLMLQLNWNYVAIIYEDDDYGRDAASELYKLSLENKICVPVYRSFIVEEPTQTFSQITIDVLSSRVAGIIYIGSKEPVKVLLETIRTSAVVSDIELIVSESVTLIPSYFQRVYDSYYAISKGALVVSAPKIESRFSVHWKDLTSLGKFQNPWLPSVNVDVSNVDVGQESVYVNYAMKAVLVLTGLFTQVQKDECPSQNDFLCPSLRDLPKQYYIDRMSSLEINLTNVFPFTSGMFENTVSEKITFRANGEINYDVFPELETYSVYNFQKCQKLKNCSFVQVGRYNNNILHLNISAIESYPLDENSDRYLDLPVAQCPSNKDCLKCVPSDLTDQVLFMAGDWYVVAVLPIFSNNDDDPLTCSDSILPSIGTDLAESIKFTIEDINAGSSSDNINVPLNQTLGLIVINGCESELVIKDKILRLHKGTLKIRPGLNSSVIQNRVLGYVGGLSSSMSKAMAQILSKLGKVQVAVGSTSPLLSDRELYPYFLRIPTADDQQVNVIISILKALKSNTIQVIYTEGSYGEGGFMALQSKAKTENICVKGHKLPVTGDHSRYNGVLAKLREAPNIRVVVTFLGIHQIEHVLSAVIKDMQYNEFVFIGSETWGNQQGVLQLSNNERLLGSLSISLELPESGGFGQRMGDIDVNDSRNPWIRYFLETRGQCTFPGSFMRKDKDRMCDSRIDQLTDYRDDPWIPFAVAATKALVIGMKDVLSSKACSSSTISCRERNPSSIASYMKKNVKLDLYNIGRLEKVFDDNGDGVVKYNILHVISNQTTGLLQYTHVVSLSGKEEKGIVLDRLKYPLDKYTSVCSTEKECSKCKGEDNSNTSDNQWMLVTLIVFGCLVVLLLVVLFVLLCCCCSRTPSEESHYEDPRKFRISRRFQFSTNSSKYLTATSSLGVVPYESPEPPAPCSATPSQETLRRATGNEYTTEELGSGFESVDENFSKLPTHI